MEFDKTQIEADLSERLPTNQLDCCASSLMNDGLKSQVFNRQETPVNESLPSLTLFEPFVPENSKLHKMNANGMIPSNEQARQLAQVTQNGDRLFSQRAENFSDKPKTLQSEAVRGATEAIASGDFEDFSRALQQALINANGDRYKFAEFNRELSMALKDKGITVRFQDGKKAGTTLSIHRDGSAEAVEFSVYLDQNGRPKVDAQTYDWVTKKDTSIKPEHAFEAKASRPSEGLIKDGKELGEAFDTARDKKDFNALYADLRRSLEHAYLSGGMDAVRKLESDTNKATQTRGEAPVVLEEDGKLKIYIAKRTDLSGAKPEGLTEKQLKDAGIIDHPIFGFLKVLDRGPTITVETPTPVDNRLKATTRP